MRCFESYKALLFQPVLSSTLKKKPIRARHGVTSACTYLGDDGLKAGVLTIKKTQLTKLYFNHFLVSLDADAPRLAGVFEVGSRVLRGK